ncbi:putative transcriptional regulator [Desulfosporosinus acidiphilus SJ4]|uniref:Putative transcriptional regulator n=1 Tax=Desulfosporosinus acidiphilus (strain DSM 22704 / JCM 16185 / SJ4) TaxID=646529 RepID=I4D2E1_DESAJ|nr:WYL domain-containing transcriptional regulator [Desulfosporosinus acidiphilus]AFM39965.1 putative transcriptional regulator [Desulfosporosinus acidiphilus SJ4]
MDKLTRQRDIVKHIAKEPWVFTSSSLSEKLGVNLVTVQRDLQDLKDNGYNFRQDQTGALYLEEGGWNGVPPVNKTTLRQMEILRLLTANSQGLQLSDLYLRFNRHDEEEVSYKTLERAVKDLQKKKFIKRDGEAYVVYSDYMLLPLQLSEQEKILLFRALELGCALAPIPEDMKSLEAKLRLRIGDTAKTRETLFVHGRTPSQDIHRSKYCMELEDAARCKNKVAILYRKDDEPARELQLNPLGIVYYWVLDNWYLVAQDEFGQKIKTYQINRILDVERLEEAFTPVAGFDLRNWFRNAWGVYRDEKPRPVKIRFYDHFSTLNRVRMELAQRKSCQLIEEEGSLLMIDQVEGLDELAVWLRGFGSTAEVLEPIELREKMKDQLLQLLHLYGGNSDGHD